MPNRGLYALLFFNTAALSLDWVLWIRITTALEPFSWFISQVLYPVCVAASLWPLLGVLYLRGEIPEHNQAFPKVPLTNTVQTSFIDSPACSGPLRCWR